jgi:hypothetical protein
VNAFYYKLAMALGVSVDRLKGEMDTKTLLAWKAIWPCLLVLFAGCVEKADVIGDLQPLVAVGGAYGVVQVKNAPPAPVGPVVPRVCEQCRGLGYLGDGRVKIPCPACSPQPKGKSASVNCENGQCRPATVR